MVDKKENKIMDYFGILLNLFTFRTTQNRYFYLTRKTAIYPQVLGKLRD